MALMRWLRVHVRPLLAGLTGVVLALLGGHVFDDVLWPLLLVPVVVTAAAIVASRWRPAIEVLVSGAAVIASVVVATVLSDGTPADVVPGIRHGPKRLLSTEWPSPQDPTMIATVALVVGVSTALAVALALRPRWRLLPLAPFAVGAVVLLGLGAPVRPPTSLLVVSGILVVATAGIGRPTTGTIRAWSPERTVVATVVIVGVATVGTASAVAWVDRADPRETRDAESSATVLDSVEATVAMRKADPMIDLMTISDRSLLARPTMPSRWRLAGFEQYDGQRWTPEIDLRPIGGRLGEAPAGADAEVLDYLVRYHSDEIDLLPIPGVALTVDRDVETDLDRVAVRLTERPDADTLVSASALQPPTAAESIGIGVVRRPVDELASGFTDEARTMAGDGTDVEQLGALAQAMRFDWELDSGAPGAGQQIALIDRFVTVTERGTREQFVTAFALMARSLGFETRVAAGFAIEPDDLGSTFTVRTEQAAVWPEVLLEDGRWLPFDPVPEREATDTEAPPPPPQSQTPAAAQPPLPPPAETGESEDDVIEDDTAVDEGWGTLGTWARRVGAGSAIVLTPVLVFVAVVLFLKWRRRRARLGAADPSQRIRGLWANVTDALVDAGMSIAPSWTDDRIADGSGEFVAGVPHETRRLAAMSSAVTFGTRTAEESEHLAADATSTAAAVIAAIGRSRTRWERTRWRLSLRSLRRSTRSPVVP